ncbi:uncharacterized protein J3R85_015566 [Psidium guajava]|nr:uncharacterized protein J3R85_015566 [Psidium guajava]
MPIANTTVHAINRNSKPPKNGSNNCLYLRKASIPHPPRDYDLYNDNDCPIPPQACHICFRERIVRSAIPTISHECCDPLVLVVVDLARALDQFATMEMRKMACALLVATASLSAVVAATEPVAAPAPSPTSAAAASLPAVGSLVGASLMSFLAYCLH